MIISTSFLKIQKDKEKFLILDKYADYMHYDVMDGNFTESKTPSLTDFDSKSPKDIHLMVTELKKYIDEYSEMKPQFMTFHVEATDQVLDTINYIKNKNIKVGLALNPETDIKEVIPYLKDIDLVLVMSVHPGKGGQAFIDITDKIEDLYNYRHEHNLNYLIEVDGGVNQDTAKKLSKADILVSGSYITDSDDYFGKISSLKKALGFTLAELMAVIVILSIIGVIVTGVISRNINTSRYETCLTQEKNIIEGAKAWAIDNPDGTSVTLADLQSGGYVEDIKSPMTQKPYSVGTRATLDANGTEVKVTYGDSKEECSK